MDNFTKINEKFYKNFKDFLRGQQSFLKNFDQKSFKIYKFQFIQVMVSVQMLNEIIIIYSSKDLLYLQFDNTSDYGAICLHQLMTPYYHSIMYMFEVVLLILID